MTEPQKCGADEEDLEDGEIETDDEDDRASINAAIATGTDPVNLQASKPAATNEVPASAVEVAATMPDNLNPNDNRLKTVSNPDLKELSYINLLSTGKSAKKLSKSIELHGKLYNYVHFHKDWAMHTAFLLFTFNVSIGKCSFYGNF